MSAIKAGLKRRRRVAGEVVYVRAYLSGQGTVGTRQVQVRKEIATLQEGLDIPGSEPWEVLGHFDDGGFVVDRYWWEGYHQWRVTAPPASELGSPASFVISGADENLSTDVGGSQLRFWDNRNQIPVTFNIRRSLSLPPGLSRVSPTDWRYNVYPAANTVVNNAIILDIYRIHLPSVVPVATRMTDVQQFSMTYLDNFWYDPDDPACPALAPEFTWFLGEALFWEPNDIGVPNYTPVTGVAR